MTHFFGKKPDHSVIADHAVAIGATIEAGIISEKFRSFLLGNFTPFLLANTLYTGIEHCNQVQFKHCLFRKEDLLYISW